MTGSGSLKGRFPFSFGVTSYIYPADIAYNIERLRDRVDEMELVLFQGADASNLPTPDDVKRFARLSDGSGLRFNVHLPLDIDIASAEAGVRDRSVQTIERILDLTHPLSPTSCTLHLPQGPDDSPVEWRKRAHEALQRLPEPRSFFCVETLQWDLREADDLLRELGLSVCIDVGHLLLFGRDVAEHFRFFSGRVTMVHLHGVKDGKDHISLARLPEGDLERVAQTLATTRYGGSLSLEVFNLDDFESSIEPFERAFSGRGKGWTTC
jgi:sugar phosphate isomerase/epimerase